MAMRLDDAIFNLGDAVAGAVDRMADALFGPPRFTRPARPPRPALERRVAPAPAPARVRPARPPACTNCRWHDQGVAVVCKKKTFPYTFDVTRAEMIVEASPRPLVTLTARQLDHYVSLADVNRRHLAHVDNSKPGLLGTVRHRGRLRLVIIEGHHRSYNARRARRAFSYYQLTEAETKECLT